MSRTDSRSDLMALADQATLIVYNCTGKIEHQWQRQLIEKINKALRHAASQPDREALGTFACPICGKAEPHYHSQEERQGTVVVAWLCEIAQVVTCNGNENVWSDWKPSLTFNRPEAPDGSIRNLRPLYAGPVIR